MSLITKYEKKMIIKNIHLLKKENCKYIFKLLYKNNIKYTENNNGCFFKLNDISDELFVKINTYINKHIVHDTKSVEMPSTINTNDNNIGIDKLKLTNYEKSILKKDINQY